MAEFKPCEFYYHSCEARHSTQERLSIPLHYYFKRGDIIALRRSIRAGVSPFLKDEYGRNILDLCLAEVESLFIASLCTSFPIDDLIAGVPPGKLLTSKFYVEDENELWSGLYEEHEKALYKSFANGNPELIKPIPEEQTQRYLPVAPRGFPASHLNRGQLYVESIKRKGAIAGHPNRLAFPSGTETQGINDDAHQHTRRSGSHQETDRHNVTATDTDTIKTDETVEASEGAPAGKSEEDMAHEVLVAVSDSLSKPLSAKVRVRLQRVIRKMRVYMNLLEELCSCEDLVADTLSRRRSVQQLMNEETTGLILTNLRLPYLFITCIRMLLEMYPCAPDGKEWNPTSPTDTRVMAGLICRLELPGHHILLFLAEFGAVLTKLLLVLPPTWNRSDSEEKDFLFKPTETCMSYLLHLAFVLDIPELFDILAASCTPGALQRTPFDWRGTLEDLQSGGKNEAIERYIFRLRSLLF